MASLVELARRQQGRARAPLRGVGDQRADARVGGRGGRDGPGRARPRALHLSRAQGARGREDRRGPLGRPPARAARRPAARLDRLHRRQPPGRRRADDVRGRVRGQLDHPARATREEDPPGGGLPPRPRRGLGQAPLPLGRPRAREPPSTGSTQTWAHAGRWPGPADDAGYAAALELGMVRDGPAAQRERMRSWLAAGARRRGRHGHARRARGLVGLGRRPRGAGRRERPARLPVLRRRAPSSASASGAGRSSPASGAARRATRTSRRCARTSTTRSGRPAPPAGG